MIKPPKLQTGDTVAIISLSSGLLGEPFMVHQKQLIEERLRSFGLKVIYTPNALKNMDFIKSNPQKRAEDLKWAFRNSSIKGIICAIGGDDTYRTVPYLLNDQEFIDSVKQNPKLFIGFSDSTINHFVFYKLGLSTLYGHCAIVDFAELDKVMLPYSKEWFAKLFVKEKNIEIKSSPIWYLERQDFSEAALVTPRISKAEEKGFEVLVGSGNVSGDLFGGCLESIYDLLTGERHGDEVLFNKEYTLFPSLEELRGKIFFLETSEEKPAPEKLGKMLKVLDNYGVFQVMRGLIIGKPQDETFYEEYKQRYMEIIGKYGKPIFYNVNFGHAYPRCILPYGCKATLDCEHKKIILNDGLVGEGMV